MESLSRGNTPVQPWERIALGLLLVLSCALMAYLCWRTGITVDEPGHLVGGRLYWEGADTLKPGDMPPLIKIVGGWAPYLFDLPLPDDLGHVGDKRREWEVALAMLERIRAARIQPVMFWSRLPMLVFPLLTSGLVWLWARRMTSPPVALIAAALFAFEPTAMAHGALFKNDLAATFSYFLFWFAAWRYWKRPTWRAAGLIALAAALAMIAKLSMLYVFGVAPAVVLAKHLAAERRLRWRALAVAASVCAVTYGLMLCAAQFDVHRLSPDELTALDRDPTLPAWFAPVARAFTVVPVPSQMWQGTVSLMSGFAYENPVYFWGEIRPHGHPLYFLGALLVKSPVTLLALGVVGIGMIGWAAWRRRLEWEDLLWILPGPLYIFLASRVPVQLGVRLVLPALPFGILFVAHAMERLRTGRAGRAAVAAGLLLFVFEASRIYPYGLSFFNVASGGPNAGFRYLADSNLDWGQGLGEVRRWYDRHPGVKLRLSYFGADQIRRYFPYEEAPRIPPPWNDQLAKGVTRFMPEPGTWYAISPNLLPGQFFAPKYRDFYAEFRQMQPVERLGYAMFLYRAESPRR
ncbi:MAG: glycosyltransferase family 39 protein [Acidobacteria bacterium]|nr:glycosyltransferase family 39 protein [Acidobacteriota bacterium]